MLRHKGFRTAEGFRNSLLNVVPSDVYYSSAYYERPEEEMNAKGWLGADLIFDIDADHIRTPCNKQHDTWICKNCGASGSGIKPEKCLKCGGQKFDAVNWPCDICLESAKQETIKLIEVLGNDFGLSQIEMNVAFSGNRGYHIHIENEAVRTLDSMARKEIVDYILGLGLEPRLHGFDIENGVGPSLEDFGWRGRIAKGTYDLLSSSQEDLEKAGLKKIAGTILQQREQIILRWKRKGPWGLVPTLGVDSWDKIIKQAAERQSVKIDTVVTTDVHRLIRLANTLHGETGLLKIQVPINEIEQFDPFKDPVAFRSGMIPVDVSAAPRFRMRDDVYGPFMNRKIELPTAAAMFLLCKGGAKIAEETDHVQ